MSSINILRETIIKNTPRVIQLKGLFDLTLEKQCQQWQVDLPIDDFDWNIGLIVGRSGAGKTTLIRELFPDAVIDNYNWSLTNSIVDDFPEHLSIKEIIQVLSSIGFSSPPNWLVPFHCLSNGEQFRVNVARALAERKELTVIDEFTSVIDRTVAKIGSSAIAKTVRKRQQKLIAASCHYDIIDWLEPDWVFDVNINQFQKKTANARLSDLILSKQIKRIGKFSDVITI